LAKTVSGPEIENFIEEKGLSDRFCTYYLRQIENFVKVQSTKYEDYKVQSTKYKVPFLHILSHSNKKIDND
jgi:hypothetical protein